MNNIIKGQLEKCKNVDLSHYDEKTQSYFIPKNTSIIIKENNSYIIKIKPTMLIPNIINNNWNQGIVPPFEYCKIIVNVYMKHMIQVDGIEYNNTMDTDGVLIWSGWLPLSEIEILKEVKE